MRDRLDRLGAAVGGLGPAALGLVAILGGCLLWISHLAQHEAVVQSEYVLPTVIQRLPGAIPTDLPLSVALPPGGRLVETLIYAEHQTHVRIEARGSSQELLGF